MCSPSIEPFPEGINPSPRPSASTGTESCAGKPFPANPLRKRLLSAIRLTAIGLLAFVCHAEENPRWDFLRSNLEIFPGTDKLFEPDANLFWKLRSNLRKVSVAERLPAQEYPFEVSTDSGGRRLHPPVPDPKWRVLFLGDSCTFGIPVSDRNTFPSLVQNHLAATRCINAGVPGHSAIPLRSGESGHRARRFQIPRSVLDAN